MTGRVSIIGKYVVKNLIKIALILLPIALCFGALALANVNDDRPTYTDEKLQECTFDMTPVELYIETKDKARVYFNIPKAYLYKNARLTENPQNKIALLLNSETLQPVCHDGSSLSPGPGLIFVYIGATRCSDMDRSLPKKFLDRQFPLFLENTQDGFTLYKRDPKYGGTSNLLMLPNHGKFHAPTYILDSTYSRERLDTTLRLYQLSHQLYGISAWFPKIHLNEIERIDIGIHDLLDKFQTKTTQPEIKECQH